MQESGASLVTGSLLKRRGGRRSVLRRFALDRLKDALVTLVRVKQAATLRDGLKLGSKVNAVRPHLHDAIDLQLVKGFLYPSRAGQTVYPRPRRPHTPLRLAGGARRCFARFVCAIGSTREALLTGCCAGFPPQVTSKCLMPPWQAQWCRECAPASLPFFKTLSKNLYRM